MLEVIDGLKAAGVKTKDIVVFERYRDEFIGAKMHEAVPEGIAWTGLGIAYNGKQVDIKGDDEKTGNLDRVTGYDPDEFMVMELVMPGLDPKDDRTRRSHLGLLVTRRVNKLVLLPVLKDHGSAGVTGALKNMSHGLVNNVCRSHGTPDTNVCNQFIPQVVNHPVIRRKCVLQIMDGIKGVYQGGPGCVAAGMDLGEQRPLLRHRPGGDGPRRLALRRRQAQGEGPAAGRRRRQAGPRPAEHRGLRHPTAPAHRPGRQPRPGYLRLQLAPGAAERDPASGRLDRVTARYRPSDPSELPHPFRFAAPLIESGGLSTIVGCRIDVGGRAVAVCGLVKPSW